jgi:hypothetical protein
MSCFLIPDDAEELLRAYADETDRTMTDILVTYIRSLARRAAEPER